MDRTKHAQRSGNSSGADPGVSAEGPACDFRLLGPLEVRRGATRLPIGRRRERCLLGILLLDPHTVVARSRLIDLLWEDEPPPAAAVSLRAHMSRLRSALGDRDGGTSSVVRLGGRDGGYVAEVDPAAVDAHRFGSLIRRARSSSDPEERVDLLDIALGLWRGPVLAEDAWPRLRDRIGAEFAELRLNAVEMLTDAKFACGRGHELVGELTALTAEHPLHEPLVGRLMLALYRSGRPAEALDAFERGRRRLAHRLGVDPGPELQRLHAAILGARGSGPLPATAEFALT